MSKVVKPIAKIGGSLLGVAGSFLPFPFNALAIGGSVGLSLLGRSGKKNSGLTSSDYAQLAAMFQKPPPLSQTVRGTNSPRVWAFGRVTQSGVSFCRETTPNGINYLEALYLNDGPVDGLDAVVCDDELVPVTNNFGGTPQDYMFPSSGKKTTSGFPGTINIYIFFEFVNATPEGKWSTLFRGDSAGKVRSFDNAWDPFWDNTHLGKGLTVFYSAAYAVGVTGDRTKIFPNGFPQYSITYRGARVYDPRDASQTFDEDNFDVYNTTWRWSENPALCVAHYINWLRSQGLTAIRGVNWASIAEAAADCERLVPIRRSYFNGGDIAYEPFARISSLITWDMEPRTVIAKFMESCDGDYGIDQYGRFTMWIGKWEEPTITFEEEDVGDVYDEMGASSNDELNYVHVNYVEPRQGGSKVEAAIYRDEYSESTIGRHTGALSFDWVTSPDQAYRLAARQIRQDNNKRRITCSIGPVALTALNQSVIRFNLTKRGIVGVYRIIKLVPESLARWHGEFIEVTPQVYEDVVIPRDPIQDLPIVNQPALATPSGLIVSAISTDNGGVAQLSLDLLVNPVPYTTLLPILPDPLVQLDGRWSTNGGLTWQNFGIIISQLILQTSELPSGTQVTMQARFVSPSGAVGAYSSSVSVNIP